MAAMAMETSVVMAVVAMTTQAAVAAHRAATILRARAVAAVRAAMVRAMAVKVAVGGSAALCLSFRLVVPHDLGEASTLPATAAARRLMMAA